VLDPDGVIRLDPAARFDGVVRIDAPAADAGKARGDPAHLRQLDIAVLYRVNAQEHALSMPGTGRRQPTSKPIDHVITHPRGGRHGRHVDG
jgi:hypothetical protein